MKQQDIVVLLKKLTTQGQSLSCRGLAEALGMSVSNVSESLERNRKAQLLDRKKQRVNVIALQEFLIHGIAYVFPVVLGRVVRGVPTLTSASPIKELIANNSEYYVWHYAKGTVRGQQLEPLYPSVPEAALRDDELYQLLVIVDALRIGRAREKEVAIEELTKRLNHYAENK
jgi:DNA-binding Lrp family transcriptional regulator